DGFKEKSINNIINSINNSKDNDLGKLIFALGIRHIGSKAGKLLAVHFKTMDNILKADKESILEIDGFGDVMAESVVDFFANAKSKELILNLSRAGVNMSCGPVETDDRFNGKTFVLTGTLPTLKRAQASEIIEKLGGKTSSSVSKKTNFVLAGEDAGSKLDKAKALGIEIIDENKFMEMIK
ncbi:MAG: NAD-dependent DNA ligase LigA, partial [Clostridiales bacterium]|nr:NAD-dependent DNA ligase LigA [Clostridiales bacterium]